MCDKHKYDENHWKIEQCLILEENHLSQHKGKFHIIASMSVMFDVRAQSEYS